MKQALTVDHLTVNYDERPALWDLTFSVPSGQIVGIIGPNGAGKTTLIKSVLGLIPTLSGSIRFFGTSLNDCRSTIAYVPQKESVDWDFPITVYDLVMMGRYGRLGLFRWPRQSDRQAVMHTLDLVGMGDYSKRQINQLSGGQQQRVFLARALMQDADIYFMDEPFSGIDMTTKEVIWDLLRKLKSKGKTIFVVHHELGSFQHYFDWAILLNIRLVASGHIDQVFTKENLHLTYGKTLSLFDEAFKLSQQKTAGL